MKNQPLNRRTFLRGSGVALSLPMLECMAAEGANAPKRFLALYVGHGFAITLRDDHPARDWSWYPRVIDGKMRFGNSMGGFNEFANQTTVLHGLEHPRVVASNGHGTADSFLTGSNIGDAVKSPSLDQVAADAHGKQTRYPSLVLGNEGGLGTKGTSRTLSYNRFGRPIPSTNDLRKLYDMMFNSDPALLAGDRRKVASGRRLVDRVLDSHRDLQRRLGRADSEKLENYLYSVREVEKDLERMEAWADRPKPRVSAEELSLEATVKEPELFIRTMYNLIYLAFQTDTTRYASYMLQSMGGGAWNDIPKTIGLTGNHHSMAHGGIGNNPQGGGLARYDLFQSKLITEFIKKLAETPEPGGSMLDNTIVYYGCSNSRTHVNRDYPLLLCGGANLGLKHGSFHMLGDTGQPLSNLYVTLLNALDVPTEKFSDSTGSLDAIV
ncbi:MAG: DUF1552 domain-containing protein [Verrucomicrobiota bacterium]